MGQGHNSSSRVTTAAGNKQRRQYRLHLDSGHIETAMSFLARVADDHLKAQGPRKLRARDRDRRNTGNDQARCRPHADLHRITPGLLDHARAQTIVFEKMRFTTLQIDTANQMALPKQGGTQDLKLGQGRRIG
ncbi:hypothetical protein D9M68_887490 [compost metagenome]